MKYSNKEKDMTFTDAMDRQIKAGFDAAFNKGSVTSPPFVELGGVTTGPPHQQQQHPLVSQWRNTSKRWLLMWSVAIVAVVVLLVLIFTTEGKSRDNGSDFEWNAVHTPGPHNLALGLIEEQTTPTTTTTTTTPSRASVDHIFASIIVNNASVPQMDDTLVSNAADAYVELYVIEGTRHRKIGATPMARNTRSPKWNYLFEHETPLSPDSLLDFEIMDWDRFGKDEHIGKVYVQTKQLLADGVNGQMISRPFNGGRLWFTIHWTEVMTTAEKL